MFNALKNWWANRGKKAEPIPAPEDPVVTFVAALRDDWEARRASMWALEKGSVSDSLRGKWRAKRELLDELLAELPGNP